MNQGKKIRLDIALVERQLVSSRELAQIAVETSLVRVNGQPARKCSQPVGQSDRIELLRQPLAYVSRGGDKLEKAIRHFQLDLQGIRVLDLGASTGGFTDCALRHGAKLVFAVDVGTGQLHPALVGHPQVKSLEQLHFKDLNLSHIDDTPVDFILIDLSFISLMLVFPLLSAFLKNGGQVVALIKPQFELQSKVRWKGGIVRDKKTRIAAAEAVVEAALQAGFQFLGMTETDVEDDSRKNQEFLALFRIG